MASEMMVERINVDELYEKKRQKDLQKIKTYNKILAKIHAKIKATSRQYKDDECCWFLIPEFILGSMYYDNNACTSYVMHKLTNNGFNVKYIHPNLLIISWSHLIPSYIRDEFQNKTGKAINEFGEYILPNADDLPASFFEETQNQPQFKNQKKEKNDAQFKKMDAYSQPIHNNVIYDMNVLQDIFKVASTPSTKEKR